MKVLVETDDEMVLKDLKADSRGRITLGSRYAGRTVSVALVELSDEENNSEQ